jgi:hypothetical protein
MGSKEVKLVQTETVDFGFIYDAKKQQQIFQKMIDRFSKLSKEYNIRTVLFTLENLDLEEQAISGTIIEGDRVSQGFCELPPLIYNFALHSIGDKIEKMRNLRKMENIIVINPINRFIQEIIFEMLTSLTGSQQFLLPSVSLNTATLTEYLNKYDSLFLLPEKTFHPPKAVIIKKTRKNNYMICIGQNGQICEKNDIVNYIQKMTNNKKHILMRGIECFKWENGPLEARIYLQKGTDGEWSVTNIMAKHGIFSRNAVYHSKISNILCDLYHNENKVVEETLVDISLRIGKFLDFYIPFLGSCTLDYIFDENYRPYLIYVTGFEQDQYVYHHMDSEAQANLLNNAFYYLLFLMYNHVTERGQQNEVDKS